MTTLFQQKAPAIMADLMRDFALDVTSAAAIAGNLGHESGGFRFLQEKKPLVPGSRGGSPLGSASTCSIPLSTSPHTVYWPSRKRASSKQMKNWLLALSGSDVRAIEQVPRTWGSLENSALRLGLSEPLDPVPVGSPPCTMKPGMTRWNFTPS